VRWEYKVDSVPVTPRELQVHLDLLGDEEWELVSTTPLASRLLLLFKRPHDVPQESELVQEEAAEISEESAPSLETGEPVEYLSEPAVE
jgi:hypothetical protein